MKSLNDIPGAWARELPSNDGAPGPNPPAGCNSSRFECTDVGILDRETGLVWFDDPSCCAGTWGSSIIGCHTTGFFRYGWRLPTVEELQTLFTAGTPNLPVGHPFSSFGLQTGDFYWTSTQTSSTTAWAIRFDTGLMSVSEPMSNSNYAWCVRGGSDPLAR
jgi:hypothetical protein